MRSPSKLLRCRIHHAFVALALAATVQTGFAYSDETSADVRQAIRAIEDARRLPSRTPNPLQAVARELGTATTLLRRLINAAGRGEGEQEAELLGACAARLSTLVADAHGQAPEGTRARQRLDELAVRLEDLSAAIDGVAAAATPAARGRLALHLLRDIESHGDTRVPPLLRDRGPGFQFHTDGPS